MASGKIFINYRREDTRGDAGRLFDRLKARFSGQVFMDVSTIEPGLDFVEAIESAVASCDATIVVIGKHWLLDETGKRRLDDPQDFVRLEVATALKRNIRVIPVLVSGATMPAPEDLPDDLRPLTRRNALQLTDQDWDHNAEQLISILERVLGIPPRAEGKDRQGKPRSQLRLGALGALALIVLVGLAVVYGRGLLSGPSFSQTPAPASKPSPAPTPAPAPKSSPAPTPAPAPKSSPAPTPAPASKPSPAPTPAPAPKTSPAPTPAPAPKTSPAPTPAPVPKGNLLATEPPYSPGATWIYREAIKSAQTAWVTQAGTVRVVFGRTTFRGGSYYYFEYSDTLSGGFTREYDVWAGGHFRVAAEEVHDAQGSVVVIVYDKTLPTDVKENNSGQARVWLNGAFQGTTPWGIAVSPQGRAGVTVPAGRFDAQEWLSKLQRGNLQQVADSHSVGSVALLVNVETYENGRLTAFQHLELVSGPVR